MDWLELGVNTMPVRKLGMDRSITTALHVYSLCRFWTLFEIASGDRRACISV